MEVSAEGKTVSRQPVVMTPENRPPGLNVVGEQITVLADGAATGSYEIFRQAGPEGSGPPPHSHPWDEAFYVIAGQITFGVDGSPSAWTATTISWPRRAPSCTSRADRCTGSGSVQVAAR
jgi:quercetin dioxygenase-like cupin family protein